MTRVPLRERDIPRARRRRSIPEADVCKGDFVHELEVPGRGELRFVWPCARPSPTLQVALDRLYAAVGLRAP